MSSLDLLTGDAQVFVTKIWASRVHVHRGQQGLLEDCLTLDDADRLLTTSGIRTPAIRMARDGRVLPESAYTRQASLAGRPLTGLVDVRKALQLFDDGATVVFQGLHRYWPPLSELVAELELELGHPCQVNAYLTPPGAQGFAVHSDAHDVFVFQTHGSKQWEVHTPDGVDDVVMEPGVCMYLPTGTPHAARAQQLISLHVTLGINRLSWRDVVRRAVASVLDEVDDSPLPAGHLDDPGELVAGLGERLAQVAAGVRRLDPAVVAAVEARRFLTSRPALLRGGLRALADDAVTDSTLLRRRRGRRCVVTEAAGGRLRLLLGDREVDVPGWLRPALDQVRAARELTPADLDLDEQSRVVLCRRLVREGLLEVVG